MICHRSKDAGLTRIDNSEGKVLQPDTGRACVEWYFQQRETCCTRQHDVDFVIDEARRLYRDGVSVFWDGAGPYFWDLSAGRCGVCRKTGERVKAVFSPVEQPGGEPVRRMLVCTDYEHISLRQDKCFKILFDGMSSRDEHSNQTRTL